MTVDRDTAWRRSVERLWRRHGQSELLATVVDEPEAHVLGEPKLVVARKHLEAAGLAREVMQIVARGPNGAPVALPVYVLLGIGHRPGQVRELLRSGGLDWLKPLSPLGAPARAYVQTERDGALVAAAISAHGTVDVGRTGASVDALRRYLDSVRRAADPGTWLGLKYPDPSEGWIHAWARSAKGETGQQPCESVGEWGDTVMRG